MERYDHEAAELVREVHKHERAQKREQEHAVLAAPKIESHHMPAAKPMTPPTHMSEATHMEMLRKAQPAWTEQKVPTPVSKLQAEVVTHPQRLELKLPQRSDGAGGANGSAISTILVDLATGIPWQAEVLVLSQTEYTDGEEG